MKKVLFLSSFLCFVFSSAFAQNLNQITPLKKGGDNFTATDDLARFTATDDLARFKSAQIKHPDKGWISLSEMSKKDVGVLIDRPPIRLIGERGFFSSKFKTDKKGFLLEVSGFLLEVAGLKMGPPGYYKYELTNIKVDDISTRRGGEQITLAYTEVEWTFMEKTRKGYTEVEWTY